MTCSLELTLPNGTSPCETILTLYTEEVVIITSLSNINVISSTELSRFS